MRYYAELILVALLLVLIYNKPPPLVSFAGTTLGKGTLVIVSVLIAHQFGISAGILAGISVILLLEAKHEGLGSGGSLRVRDERRKIDASKESSRSRGSISRKCKTDADCGTCNSSCADSKCVITSGNSTETTSMACATDKDCGACETTCSGDGICQMSFVDQVSLDRQLKQNALTAGMTASRQSNDQTSNVSVENLI